MNGLNFATDIARLDRPDLNVIRAPKRFRSLTIDELQCRDGCTIQGIDMEDWIDKAAMTGLNHTIQGTVYLRNPVISHIDALGLVNNMTINTETVLLKTATQRINGIVTIGNHSNIDSINSLTIDNLYVNYINEKNVREFFESLVKKDGHGNYVGEIFSNIEFTDDVTFETLKLNGQLNGINVSQIITKPYSSP